MNDHISRKAMLMDLQNKLNNMNKMHLHNDAKNIEQLISYVKGFPPAEEPSKKRGHWLYEETKSGNYK